jgi:small-conductance mechanosensitive channel
VLTLLLSASFYPQAPRLFWAAVEAAALIPTVLILRELIDRRWFSMLDALVVFYFLDQLRSIAAVVPLVARVLLLVEMAGASALVVLFIRASRTNAVTGRIGRIIRFASWFWLVIFSLALLADVIGYTSLANLLGDAALGSSYLAVILYAFTRIVTGLIVIALHSRPLVLLKMVREHQWLFQRRLNLMVAWIAVAGWALGVLASLSVASAAYEMVRKDLSRGFYLGQIPVTPGHILAFLVAIWASVQVSRFLRFVLEEDVYDRLHISGGISYAVSKMLNYVVLLVGFFFAVSALGYDMTNFTILASAFGVGLGFGMQNIVNNFVSGLILLFERPIKVGDVIQMDDTTGVVAHIGIRASIIRTLNSAEIIVPNGNLISGKVTNWTLSNRQRGLEIPINVGPGTDPARVMQLLVTVARAQPMIIKSPPPEVFLTAFSADAFSYQLHAWTNAADQWIQIRSDLSIAIHDALVKEQIPFK